MFKMASYDTERMEEEIQELETKQENAVVELDYVLELLDPDSVDIEDLVENAIEAVRVIRDIMKELK